MGFIDGIFTLLLEISNIEEGVYDTIRLNVCRHQNEGVELFYAKLIAYCHLYIPEIQISKDFTEARAPQIYLQRPDESFAVWSKVGNIDLKEIRHTRRATAKGRVAIYFFSDEQIHNFCHQLRGSQENWVTGIEFYRIDPHLIAQLSSNETSRIKWGVTFLESQTGFIIRGEETLDVNLVSLDIWEEYQKHLEL